MNRKRRKTRTIVKDKDVQGTYYITASAAKKLKAATLRGQPPGVQASKSDVVSFCLEESADAFTGARPVTIAVFVLAVLLTAVATSAQCLPKAGEDLGQPRAAGDSKTYSSMVPLDEVWLIRAAGIGYSDPIGNAQLEYALEVIHPVAPFTDASTIADDGRCCWRIPVARAPLPVNGTPTLALDRPLLLLSGERLAARVNVGTPVPELRMNLFLVFWRFPATCVAAMVKP